MQLYTRSSNTFVCSAAFRLQAKTLRRYPPGGGGTQKLPLLFLTVHMLTTQHALHSLHSFCHSPFTHSTCGLPILSSNSAGGGELRPSSTGPAELSARYC